MQEQAVSMDGPEIERIAAACGELSVTAVIAKRKRGRFLTFHENSNSGGRVFPNLNNWGVTHHLKRGKPVVIAPSPIGVCVLTP